MKSILYLCMCVCVHVQYVLCMFGLQNNRKGEQERMSFSRYLK